jgi:hypothetical protein
MLYMCLEGSPRVSPLLLEMGSRESLRRRASSSSVAQENISPTEEFHIIKQNYLETIGLWPVSPSARTPRRG